MENIFKLLEGVTMAKTERDVTSRPKVFREDVIKGMKFAFDRICLRDGLEQHDIMFLQGMKVICENAILKIEEALDLIEQYSQIDESHHKAWCLDQVTRKLTGETYPAFIQYCKTGEDGVTYSWDEGIPP